MAIIDKPWGGRATLRINFAYQGPARNVWWGASLVPAGGTRGVKSWELAGNVALANTPTPNSQFMTLSLEGVVPGIYDVWYTCLWNSNFGAPQYAFAARKTTDQIRVLSTGQFTSIGAVIS